MPRAKTVPRVPAVQIEPGSVPLENIRWERFSQSLAIGRTQFKAYTEAGFTPNSRAAARLAVKAEVLDRVNWMRSQALVDTTLSIAKVVAELEKMAFSNMLDYIKIDDDGNPTLNFANLTRDQAAAIVEITTDEIANPRDGSITRRTRFKLCDKRGTLMDLGKWLGMYKEVKDINVKGVVFHVDANDMAL